MVKIDPRYFRPAEVETLLGDPSKAKAKLGWTPEITVHQMCAEMLAADAEEAKKHGYNLNVGIEEVLACRLFFYAKFEGQKH